MVKIGFHYQGIYGEAEIKGKSIIKVMVDDIKINTISDAMIIEIQKQIAKLN